MRVVLRAALGAALVVLAACEIPDPLAATSNRPGIPMPATYEGTVRSVSDVLVVEEAPALSFNPAVSAAFDAQGTNLGVTAGSRVSLMASGERVLAPRAGSITTQALPAGQLPNLQLIRYWVRLGSPESFAGGAAVSRTTSTTRGVESTKTQSFSQSLTIETEASAGGLFASASVKASASFTATQGFSSTATSSETVEKTFTVSPRAGTNLLYSVWQLVEEIRYVSGTGVDAPLYSFQGYTFSEDSLRFVYRTDEIVPVSAYYEQ